MSCFSVPSNLIPQIFSPPFYTPPFSSKCKWPSLTSFPIINVWLSDYLFFYLVSMDSFQLVPECIKTFLKGSFTNRIFAFLSLQSKFYQTVIIFPNLLRFNALPLCKFWTRRVTYLSHTLSSNNCPPHYH